MFGGGVDWGRWRRPVFFCIAVVFCIAVFLHCSFFCIAVFLHCSFFALHLFFALQFCLHCSFCLHWVGGGLGRGRLGKMETTSSFCIAVFLHCSLFCIAVFFALQFFLLSFTAGSHIRLKNVLRAPRGYNSQNRTETKRME